MRHAFGAHGLPSWVTMNRAALPSGDIISVIPVLTSRCRIPLGHIEEVSLRDWSKSLPTLIRWSKVWSVCVDCRCAGP